MRKGEKRSETGSIESRGFGRLEREKEIADSDSSTYKLSSRLRECVLACEVVFSVMPLRDCSARSIRVEEA